LSSRCDLLVVAAFEPELLGLDVPLSKRTAPLDVREATVGVGLVQAALGAASALETHKPRALVLVGTCGAYPGRDLDLGGVVVSRSVALLEPAVALGRAAFPEVISLELEAHGTLARALSAMGARLVDVMTTLAVTTDDELARSLGERGAVEHLEAFAVASACEKAGVPFVAVLGVANRVGGTGRTEWRSGHEAAGRAAASLVLRWIEAHVARVGPAELLD
jgi:nucleoside phosphorylase